MKRIARKVEAVVEPREVSEGAGVLVRRSIGGPEIDSLDPFLLLDHFESKDPDDYRAGFPLHPHRGIETVTYVLAGEVRHKDTLGNSGAIGAGDVQWMTAGGGIMHEEMPQVRPEGIAGFQLWVNLPAKLKMTPPRYQEVRSASIPEIRAEGGARVRVITGRAGGTAGPVSGIAVDPLYLDVALPPRASFTHPIPRGHAAFAYLFEGQARFAAGGGKDGSPVSGPRLVVFGDGDSVEAAAQDAAARFLLVSGKPLREPVARHGPFVMNTRAEIEQALRDLRQGTFVAGHRAHDHVRRD